MQQSGSWKRDTGGEFHSIIPNYCRNLKASIAQGEHWQWRFFSKNGAGQMVDKPSGEGSPFPLNIDFSFCSYFISTEEWLAKIKILITLSVGHNFPRIGRFLHLLGRSVFPTFAGPGLASSVVRGLATHGHGRKAGDKQSHRGGRSCWTSDSPSHKWGHHTAQSRFVTHAVSLVRSGDWNSAHEKKWSPAFALWPKGWEV